MVEIESAAKASLALAADVIVEGVAGVKTRQAVVAVQKLMRQVVGKVLGGHDVVI